jgi:RNA polymerase sigma factor (sigma-70 family)
MPDPQRRTPARGETPFLTTRWSVVLEAGRGDEPSSRKALGELCEAYWYPLYAYVRRRGHRQEDAQDLTQAFFARLLEKNGVVGADPERGRFRAFLLGALKHFLANEWDREQAQKRGGGRPILSLDFRSADERFVREPMDNATPERAFERTWALAVLESALARLESDYRARGRGAIFERLRGSLVARGELDSYRDIARELGTSEGAVKVAAHRLRQAFRAALRAEIAETVGGPEDLEHELGLLIAALGS